MDPKDLARRLTSKNQPVVLDVRSALEYRSGHIPGARHVPFWAVLLQVRKLPEGKDARLVITCEHGPRAQAAQKLLALAGRRKTELLDGHMSGWRRLGLPVEKG